MSIFGITDDGDDPPMKKLGNLPPNHRKKMIPDNKRGQRKTITVEPPPPKVDPTDLATNVVELSPEDIDEFKSDVESLTKEYSDFLRKNVIPHLMAFDAAVDYNKALMVDGLGRDDVTTDNSLLISLKWLLHVQVVEYFCTKLNIKDSPATYEKLADLMKSELAKASTYSDQSTVGVVKSLDGKLGVKASMRRRD
jgi:hypothetical protein